MDRVWRHLHTPFELCQSARDLHECSFEVFDADRAGCTRCGYIHVCSTEECNLIQTEDARVCDITGLCLITSNFITNHYSDCVAYQGSATTSEYARVQLSDVRMIVNHILTSQLASSCRAHVRQKFQSRVHYHIQSAIMAGDTSAISIIEESFATVCQRIDLPHTVSTAEMLELCDLCAREICSLMCVAYYKLSMQLRPSELREIVVGLLFLMRTGIAAHGVVVLKCVPVLTGLLPVENLLPKVFALPSKLITDIENRFKMHIRQYSREKLLAVGFGMTPRETTINDSHTTIACH